MIESRWRAKTHGNLILDLLLNRVPILDVLLLHEPRETRKDGGVEVLQEGGFVFGVVEIPVDIFGGVGG